MSFAEALSQTAAAIDVWNYSEDLEDLSAYLAAGGELGDRDALLSAVGRLDTYRGEQTVRRWLHRLITQECLYRSGRAPGRIEAYFDGVVDGRSHPTMNGPVTVDALELRREALDGFAALPDGYRAVLLLKEGQGLTVEKTAKLMGATPAAVRSTLYRARSRWRVRRS